MGEGNNENSDSTVGIDRWLGIWYCTAPECSAVNGQCNIGITPEGDGLYFTNEMGNTATGIPESGGFRIPQWGELFVILTGSGARARLNFDNNTWWTRQKI